MSADTTRLIDFSCGMEQVRMTICTNVFEPFRAVIAYLEMAWMRFLNVP